MKKYIYIYDTNKEKYKTKNTTISLQLLLVMYFKKNTNIRNVLSTLNIKCQTRKSAKDFNFRTLKFKLTLKVPF